MISKTVFHSSFQKLKQTRPFTSYFFFNKSSSKKLKKQIRKESKDQAPQGFANGNIAAVADREREKRKLLFSLVKREDM